MHSALAIPIPFDVKCTLNWQAELVSLHSGNKKEQRGKNTSLTRMPNSSTVNYIYTDDLLYQKEGNRLWSNLSKRMKETLGNPLRPPPHQNGFKIAKHSMSTCTSHRTFKPTYKLVQPTYKLYWDFLIHKLCLNNFNRSCNSKTVSHPSFKRIKSHCCLLQCTHHVLPSQYNMLITPTA
jgi:hypothetical protein